MKVPYDAVLPQVNVLGSTMACREAGNPDAPVALFLHGNQMRGSHQRCVPRKWLDQVGLVGACTLGERSVLLDGRLDARSSGG
jgi:hypothetical protein